MMTFLAWACLGVGVLINFISLCQELKNATRSVAWKLYGMAFVLITSAPIILFPLLWLLNR